MKAGEVLFQDDVEKSPAKETPKHWSGNPPPAGHNLAQLLAAQYKLDAPTSVRLAVSLRKSPNSAAHQALACWQARYSVAQAHRYGKTTDVCASLQLWWVTSHASRWLSKSATGSRRLTSLVCCSGRTGTCTHF